MKKTFFLLVGAMLYLFAGTSWAQTVTAHDTIAFTVTKVVPEPDPNNNDFTFGIYANDATGEAWKMQINYTSTSMYGTFSDADFNLTGSGKYYNYIRKVNNDRYMCYFTHLDVVVSNQNGDTHVSINGLVSDNGVYRRVLTTAIIPAPHPKDTIDVDLGVVAVIPNTFYGSLIMEASNANYTLEFGIAGTTTLRSQTYYRTEMLRPDFVRLPNDTIRAANAEMDVTDNASGLQDLVLRLLSEDTILYRIHMHTGTMQATDTVLVECSKGQLRDMTDTYGLYQMYGEGTAFNAAIAVHTGVIYNGLVNIPLDSIYLDFTTIARRSDLKQIRVQHATAQLLPDTADATRQILYANLLGTDATLYQVVIPFGGSGLTGAVDTVIIECGDYVGRVDYTLDAGYVGFVLGNDDADVHISLYNGMQMSGLFTSEYFVYEGSYVTTYTDSIIRFSDVQAAEMRMDSVGDTLNIALDVIQMSNVMYRFTARLLPKRCLTGGNLTGDSVSYSLNLSDDVDMVAYRMKNASGNIYYKMQFQHAESWDSNGNMTGNYEIWDFVFPQSGYDGITGTYGYNADNLYTDRHVIFEGGTEIYLGALAGTLTITPKQAVRVPMNNAYYRSHYYEVTARLVAPNGLLYSLKGLNILVCADYDTDQLAELSENELTALEEALSEQGMHVRKVFRGGVILLETDDATYNVSGMRVK